MFKRSLLLTLLLALLVPWAAKAQTLTVHDGSGTNNYVPFFGYYADEDQTNQMIYPATELADMNGKAITEMVFYWQEGDYYGNYYGVGTWTVSLGETTATTLSGLDNTTSLTPVFTGVLDEAGGLFDNTAYTLTIAFDDQYVYGGGNLLVQFSHTGTGEYEYYVFKGESVTGASYCYDSQRNFLPKTTFSYSTPSSCAKPENLTYNYTEGNPTATVTWESTASNFNVDINGTITAVNKKTYTFNVDPATTYTVKVQADCGGGELSGWTSTSFFSGCTGVAQLPYSYGFENADEIICWTVNATGSYSSNTGVSTNYPRTGTNSFMFFYTTNPPQYLISPEFSGYSNGLHVEFWYRQYSSGVETFKVGYSSTTTDDSAFTWGEEITASTTYQRFSANYPVTTKYVAVKHTSDDQYYLFLDDFLFEESANCLEPTNVVASNETTTGATLNWTAGGEETMWDIYVTDDATVVPNDGTTPTVSNTSTKPYPLTGLTPATTYYAYVRAKCGAKEASAWGSPAIFNTDCVEKDLPYSYGFEDNEFDICWSIINTNTSYCGIDIMDPTGSSGNHVLAFYRGSSTGNLVAVSPEISSSYPLNGYQITFDACFANGTGGSMTAGKLGIGIITDPTDFTTFELIEEIDITDGYSTFGTHTVMFNSYTGSGQYIAIQDIHTQNGYVLVDNIAVTELPACMPATALGATPSSTSAELSWTANNGETSWTLYYKKTSDTDYTEIKNVKDNPYTLTPLDASTNYDYYVVANCSSTETSNPSAVYSFKTTCGSVSTFPWTEDFEKLTVAGEIPECWDNDEGTTTNTAYKWRYNTTTSGNGAANGTGHNNSKCVVFNSYNNSSDLTNFLKTVPLSLPASPAMQLSFWYKNPAGGDFSVYLSTDGGATHTIELATGLTGASSWTQHGPINLSAYAGQDVVIVFKATSNYGYGDAYIYLDDVTVNEAPACSAPNALGAVPSTTSAQLSWTANSGETSWNIFYKKASDTDYTEVANVKENPYTLSGLNAGTDYVYYVEAKCSGTETSDPSSTFNFTTECEAFTITATDKYTQDFESPVVTSVYNSTTDLHVPNCWENPYTTGSTAGQPHLVAKGASYNYSTSQVLLFYGSGSNYVTLPEFTNNLQDLQISFKWATESNSNGTLTLGYITDGDVNYNTFTEITGASYPASSSSYHTLIQADPVDLSALPATAKRLAFRWVYSGQYSCNVDDLVVELIPSCKIPTGLTCTDYTATTATFDWTASGANQTAWQLYISETNVAPADDIDLKEVIDANTHPFTVTSGLTAEHTYYAWVRGNCTASSEGYSEWSEGIEFMPSQYKDFTYQETAGSSTSYIPFYGAYCNNATKGQILIPASAFPADMVDATVRRLTFYTNSSYASVNWGTAEFDVLVTEVDATSFATTAFFDWNAMTTVYSGSLSVSGNQMVINLDAPFSYTGGNLVIGFNLTTTGASASVYWVATYGSTYLGAYQYGTNTVNRSMYQPKTTFNYLPNPTPRPINPHATEELSTEATLAWTAPNSTEVTGYQYQYKKATATDWPTALTDETGLTTTITSLTPETTYDFRVRAVYPGPAYSQYAETQFTTTAACAVPDGLVAANITMNTADLTWNASSEVANYTVQYKTAAYYDLFQGFENGFEGWTVINESTSSGSPNNVPDINAAAKRTDNYGFRFSSWSGSSTGYDQYLISPMISFTGKVKFYYREQTTSYGDEKFKVGYSSTDNSISSFTWGDVVVVSNDAYADDKYYEEAIPDGTKYVAIYYCTGASVSRLFIDDITLGNLNPAGTWQTATTAAPNTGAYTIEGLTAGTKYDVRVYANCTTDPDSESTTTTITTLADGTKVFNNAAGDGMWSTAANWVPSGAPTITDNAVLRASATITGAAAANKITFEGTTTPTLTINDGGTLQTNNNVAATVKKSITGYTAAHAGEATGYYLIANPLSSTIYSSSFATIGLTSGNYDLYTWSYSNSDGQEWRNYKQGAFSSLATKTGYLYAHETDVDLTFTGTVAANNTDVTMNLNYGSTSYEFNGWNLVGNPFVCDAYIADTTGKNLAFYRMNNDGDGFEAVTGTIKPMEGFFVQASASSQSFKFSRTASAKSTGKLNIQVAQVVTSRNAQRATDNAIIRFDGGNTLEKFSFNENNAKVYIPQDNKDFAVVNAENEGEMPVCFKAAENGNYTLSFTAQDVEFSYLHLIDNMTGNDVDLLETPSYSFDARTIDYASRFKLVFTTGHADMGDDFGFFDANGNLNILGIEGLATLQVIDVTGRIISNETFSGNYSKAINAKAGVYMLRLIQGNDVRTQKIVVK